MTRNHQQPSPATPATEAGEPRAISAPAPVALFVVLFALLFWAMAYFDRNSGWFSATVYLPYRSSAEVARFQPPTGGADLELGRQKYEMVCGLCHNNDGTGKPNQAPPLTGSDWVTGSPARVIRIPLAGLSGPLQVKGEMWNLSMPAMGATMSDEELAAVLTYMRQSWGNKASAITPDEVKAVRAEIGNRQAYSAEELGQVP